MSTAQQNDPLAIYRIGKVGAPSAVQQPDPFEDDDESQQENKDPLNDYRIKPPETTDYTLKDVPRVTAGLAARGAETAGGAAGGFQKGLGIALDYALGVPAEYFSGKKLPKLRETLRDPHSILGKHRETVEELERSSLAPGERSEFTQLPTSQELKENITKPGSKALTGNENYLEPQNPAEKNAQEFTQDIVSLALPGSGVQSWTARLGLALSGQSAKELARQLDFSPSTQELAKMGALGIVSLAQIGNAPQFARQFFQQTKALMPRGVRMNATALQNNLNRIRQSDWFLGHTIPETRAAREMIDAIQQRINNGTISAREAMTLRENINRMAQSLGAFSVEGGHRGAHVARLNEVRDALIDGMEQTLGRAYPNWWHTYQDANAAFAITQRSSALGDYIANNYAKPVFSEAGKILFGNVLAKGAAGIAKLGIAGAGIASGAKIISLTNRMARSETLRNYYSRVIRAASNNDALALSEALQKFDEYALKEEKQQKATKPLLRRQK